MRYLGENKKSLEKFIFGLILFIDYMWIIQGLFTSDPFIVLEEKKRKLDDSTLGRNRKLVFLPSILIKKFFFEL